MCHKTLHLKYYRHASHLKDEVSKTILVHTPLALSVKTYLEYIWIFFTFFKYIVWCYNLLYIYTLEVLNFKVPEGTPPSLQQLNFSFPFHHFLPSNNNLIDVLLHLLEAIASLKIYKNFKSMDWRYCVFFIIFKCGFNLKIYNFFKVNGVIICKF